MRQTIRLLATCLALPGLSALFGQEYLYRHYQNNNELPNQFVSSLLQDSDGRIWLSTRRGIVIYNGVDWQMITRQQTGSPADISLSAEKMIQGADGAIWMLDRRTLSDANIFRYQDKKWRHWPVDAAAVTKADETWIDSLVTNDARNGETLILAVDSGAVVSFQEQTGWRRQAVAAKGGTLRITGMCRFHESVLFSTSAGLYRYDQGRLFSASEFNHQLPDRDLLGVAWDSQQTGSGESLWVIGRDWIRRIGPEGSQLHPVGFPAGDFDYSSVIGDHNGGLFILLQHQNRFYAPSLSYFSAKEKWLENISRHSSLRGMIITCITQDREKTLWMGTSRGPCKLVNPSFKTFRSEHGLLEDEVSAIHFLKDEVILGHNIGFSRYQNGRFVQHHFSSSKLIQRVTNIDSAADGTLYLACSQLGLLVIRPDGRQDFFSPPGPDQQTISGVCVDAANDRIWVASNNAIFSFSPDGFRLEGPPSLPPLGSIRNIQRLGDRTVAFSTTSQGLITFDGRRWRQIRSQMDPRANSVYYSLLHPDHGLLLATSAGLFRVDGDTVRPFRLGDNPLTDLCFSLNLDPQNRLWIGTQKGVISWDGKLLQRHRSSDGVPGHEINRNALKIAPDGRVWIGSNGGVSIYQPLLDQSASIPPPPVVLHEIRVNRLSLAPGEDIHLKYDQNSFSIHFFCPSYINEFENRFRFRLLGYMEQWSELGGQQLSQLFYQNIPAGRYSFEIQAANAYGEWGPISRSAPIHIAQVFWKSPAFQTIAVFFILLLPTWLTVSLLQKRQAHRLEDEVRARTEQLTRQKTELERLNSELRLANSTKNKFFSIIAHDLRTPFTSLLTGTEFLIENFDSLSHEMKRRHSHEIHAAAKLTYELVNNLLDWSRTQLDRMEFIPSRIDLTRLIRHILQLFETDTSRKSLQISLLIPPRCDMLGDRHMIRFILRNLISNAIKFTPRGGHLSITVYDHGTSWSIGIQDTGIGISRDKLDTLNSPNTPLSSSGTEGERGTGLGLILCREFIQLHNGSLTITSQVNQGSLFTVKLPKGDIKTPRQREGA